MKKYKINVINLFTYFSADTFHNSCIVRLRATKVHPKTFNNYPQILLLNFIRLVLWNSEISGEFKIYSPPPPLAQTWNDIKFLKSQLFPPIMFNILTVLFLWKEIARWSATITLRTDHLQYKLWYSPKLPGESYQFIIELWSNMTIMPCYDISMVFHTHHMIMAISMTCLSCSSWKIPWQCYGDFGHYYNVIQRNPPETTGETFTKMDRCIKKSPPEGLRNFQHWPELFQRYTLPEIFWTTLIQIYNKWLQQDAFMYFFIELSSQLLIFNAHWVDIFWITLI